MTPAGTEPAGRPAEAATPDFVRRLPKAELHVHLEGTMRPATLLELARRRGIDLPARDEAGLREWFRFRDFGHFVDIYLTCSNCLRQPEDFQLLARDFLEEQARQSALYSEIHFTVATHIWNGLDGREVMDALTAALAEGPHRFGVEARLILDIVRDLPERADKTLDMALEFRPRGVVALGLTGREALFGNQPFRDHFAEAARQGLRRVAHAGEHAGPEAIRSALEICGAERIGHGVRAIDDPGLVAQLASSGVPLEVCPTSNVCLGVFPDLASHAFDRLRRAGVAVTVNSDDPPMFSTSLEEEYLRLARTFGYGAETLRELAWAGLRHAFLEPADRARLEAEFGRRMPL